MYVRNESVAEIKTAMGPTHDGNLESGIVDSIYELAVIIDCRILASP